MASDLIKTTPLMEYIDMLWNRLAVKMANHPEVTRWWVEVHPPEIFDGTYLNDKDRGTVGYVKIKGMSPPKTVTYRADFMAAQRGARAGAEILEQVVEHHVTKFIEAITS